MVISYYIDCFVIVSDTTMAHSTNKPRWSLRIAAKKNKTPTYTEDEDDSTLSAYKKNLKKFRQFEGESAVTTFNRNEAYRSFVYRSNLSDDQKAPYNIKAKIRSAAYRQRCKERGIVRRPRTRIEADE